MEKYNENSFIISSRPSDVFISWPSFKEMHTKPLNKRQALEMIRKIDYDQKTKDKFYEKLENEMFSRYKTFVGNPLLLTIMLIVFRENAFLPDNLCEFYEEAFSVLFYKHDASKQGYKRTMKSGLSYLDFKNVFAHFCFKSFLKEQFSFSESDLITYFTDAGKKLDINFNPLYIISDLVKNVCMFVKEGLKYTFIHRSFQEYFAAVYTTKLTDKEQKSILTSFAINNLQSLNFEYLHLIENINKKRFYNNFISILLDEWNCEYKKLNYDKEEFLIQITQNLFLFSFNTSKHFFLSCERLNNLFKFYIMLKFLGIYYPDKSDDDNGDIFSSFYYNLTNAVNDNHEEVFQICKDEIRAAQKLNNIYIHLRLSDVLSKARNKGILNKFLSKEIIDLFDTVQYCCENKLYQNKSDSFEELLNKL